MEQDVLSLYRSKDHTRNETKESQLTGHMGNNSCKLYVLTV